MSILFLAVSAVVPSLLLMWYFHRRDVFPEPPRVLWATFGLGVVIVVPVLMVALPLEGVVGGLDHALGRGLASAFLQAAIPEEVFKFLVLWLYAARHRAFDEPMDGIVYGVAASLGFATLENILYVTAEGFGVAVVRAFSAVPGHAFLGAIMGFYVGLARSAPADARRGLLVRALGWPILLHGLYDFPLMAADHAATSVAAGGGQVAILLIPIAPLIVIVEWRWTLALVRRLRREQLAADEAPVVAPAAESPVLAWVQVIAGGLAAAFGGLMTLGIAVGLAFAETPSEDLAPMAVGWVIIGLLPLGLGLWGFIRGVVRLNRGSRPPV